MMAKLFLVFAAAIVLSAQAPIEPVTPRISQRCLDALVQRALATDRGDSQMRVRWLEFRDEDGVRHHLSVEPDYLSALTFFYGPLGVVPRTEQYRVDRSGKLLGAATAHALGTPRGIFAHRDVSSADTQRDLHDLLERFAAYGKAQGICE